MLKKKQLKKSKIYKAIDFFNKKNTKTKKKTELINHKIF